MKMGTSQKQNIAIQHRYFKNHGGQIRAQNPVSFEKWFLVCLRKCEKKGAEFDFLSSGLIRIKWPEQVPKLRTTSDFLREYEEEYLPRFSF